MDLILGLVMLGSGVYALIKGRIPTFLFGSPQYEVTGASARAIGLLMMVPLPAMFVLPILLLVLFGDGSRFYAMIAGFVVWIGVAVASVIAVHVVRKPITTIDENGQVVQAVSEEEAAIYRKTNGSLYYLITSIFYLPVAFVFFPLVYIRTTQALRLINTYGVGEQYRARAQRVRILAVGIFFIQASIAGCVVLVPLISIMR